MEARTEARTDSIPTSRPAHVSLYLLGLTLAFGYFNLKITPPQVPASEGADKNSTSRSFFTVKGLTRSIFQSFFVIFHSQGRETAN